MTREYTRHFITDTIAVSSLFKVRGWPSGIGAHWHWWQLSPAVLCPRRRQLFSRFSREEVEIIRCRCTINVEEDIMVWYWFGTGGNTADCITSHKKQTPVGLPHWQVRCECCQAWQHCVCMSLRSSPPDKSKYLCELCQPRPLTMVRYERWVPPGCGFRSLGPAPVACPWLVEHPAHHQRPVVSRATAPLAPRGL